MQIYRLLYTVLVKYAKDMQEICQKYAGNKQVYATNMQVYVNNMQEICKKYANI